MTPVLPGDSLLFIVGTLSGNGLLNIWIIYPLLLCAVFLGDNTNYWIGRTLGPKVFSQQKSRLFNKAYLEKTRKFFEKHGGKTIIIARFVPIVRTFAPFVAGVGKMHYLTFLMYSITGGLFWVSLFTLAGYFFGGLSLIKNNFELAVVVVIVVSTIPIIIEYLKHQKESRLSAKALQRASYKEINKTFKKEKLND